MIINIACSCQELFELRIFVYFLFLNKNLTVECLLTWHSIIHPVWEKMMILHDYFLMFKISKIEYDINNISCKCVRSFKVIRSLFLAVVTWNLKLLTFAIVGLTWFKAYVGPDTSIYIILYIHLFLDSSTIVQFGVLLYSNLEFNKYVK